MPYIFICLLATPITESQYWFKGTFSLPYANISQDIQIWFDKLGQREKISYFDDTVYSIWDFTSTKQYYSVLTYLPEGGDQSIPHCFQNPIMGVRNNLLEIFPDLTNWDIMPETKIMNKLVKHYRLNTVDEGRDTPPILKVDNFGSTRADQQDYFCIENGNYCDPVRWEIHGFNTIFGSHFDYYVLDINEFQRKNDFDAQIFQKPDLDCQKVEYNIKYMTNLWTFSLQSLQHKSSVRAQNMNLIQSHKSNVSNFTLKPNRFTDTSFVDFLNMFTGYNGQDLKDTQFEHRVPFITPQLDDSGVWFMNGSIKQLFPKNFDWRIKGGITPVRDQANCGSCWTFATAAAIESRINILYKDNKYKPLFQMSEQAIVDCIWTNDFSHGLGLHACLGGHAQGTMDRIIKDFKGKLPKLSEYPYIGQGMKCDKSVWNFEDVTLTSFSSTKQNSIGELKYALLSGPVAVSIQVTNKMTFYSGGIFDDIECTNDPKKLVHQVALVGWGYDDELQQQYWIIKNSWSNAWGVDGYIFISSNKNVDCGITLATAIPNLQRYK
ncbi:Cathepsin_L [Hexamita inflata]|uniref:Cathepsin L n=1 Tax=Hexamita inflata TaxID=28002 RepID=A0AA86V3A5_9EUKA|nr:Cathepsin L [Hexamita inflata]